MRRLAYTHELSIRAIDQAQQDGRNPPAAQEERDKKEKIHVTNNTNK